MAFDPNSLFYEMGTIFQKNYSEDNKVVIANEGGTRSSKTWDTFHFIYTFCNHNQNQGNDIYILRDTLINCKEKTFKEFKKCMKIIGANLTYFSEHQKPYVNIFGNHVYFRGLDSEDNTEGYPSDIIFINEALETQKDKVDGLKMRCRKLMIMDWNPKFTQHWCFDLKRQPNVFFTHSTYKNNKHLKKSIIRDIEAYEPWVTGSYEVRDNTLFYNDNPIDESNQPPPHLENIENATADEFRWKVYGLGLRGAMQGVIFKSITWIDEFPPIAHTYGMDFGFVSDPLAFGKYARQGRNIYLELLIYTPISTSIEVDAALKALNISKYIPITADSSDKYVSEKKGTVQMVRELFDMGWEISKVSKTKGVMFWLEDMKNYKIHIVKNRLYEKVKIEQENYVYKEINGILINQPSDKHNHFWDACFVGDTMITTIRGLKKIQHINTDDMVLTSNGWRKVLNRWDNGVKKVYSFRMQFDTFTLSLECTKEHKVKTDKGWIKISRLKQGMTVYVTKCLMEKSSNSIKGNAILVEGQAKCTGSYGNFIRESVERDMIFTIKTKTVGITNQKTLKKSNHLSIDQNTSRTESKTILNGLKSSMLKPLKLLKNGLKLPKERSAKANHPKRWRKEQDLDIGLTGLRIVSNVLKSFYEKPLPLDSAQMGVNQNGAESTTSTMKKERVNIVETNGLATNILVQDAVVKCVLERIDSQIVGQKKVYDLNIDNLHEYVANGLLVHNCRYSHMSHDINNLEVESY